MKFSRKVTLITTVKNEEKSIERFLDSINKQTIKPGEIIVVDANSSDRTRDLIKNCNLKIKLMKKKGNRSFGRNTAIKNSSNEIIACTDAGCVLDKYWLERITKPFADNSIDIVSGFYKPITNSAFEKCLATYTCTMPDQLDFKNFLPSSRSIAFRKSSWEKVKGYPEELDTCEDLVFDKKLKKSGMKFITVKSAIVYWPQRKNIIKAAVQFFKYAKGDGEARYIRFSTPFLYARYLAGCCLLGFFLITGNETFFLVLLAFFILYLLWAIGKNYKYVKNWRAFIYLPLLQLTSDLMVLVGTTYGLMKPQRV